MLIKTVVLSGGGIDGAMFVGAIRRLEEEAVAGGPYAICKVRKFVGCSIGAIIALFLAMGLTSHEIEQRMLEGFKSGALSRLNLVNLLSAPTSLGIDDGTSIVNWVAAAMVDRGIDANITFRRFAALTGNDLIIAVTNLTRCQRELMSLATSGDVPVMLAVRMSMSLPVLFTPVVWNNCVYVDGAVMDVCPMSHTRPPATCTNSTTCTASTTSTASTASTTSTTSTTADVAAAAAEAEGGTLVLNLVICEAASSAQPSVASVPDVSFQTYMKLLYRVIIARQHSMPCANTAGRAHVHVIDMPSLFMSADCPIKFNVASMQIDVMKNTEDAALRRFIESGYSSVCSFLRTCAA
jgi:predicted acylesterase/phospholipase RssA